MSSVIQIGSGVTALWGGQKWPFPITLASGLYNSLYYRTSRDSLPEWCKHRKLFSKWRPSAILNLGKFPFWSRDLYLPVIRHLLSEFRVHLIIRRRGRPIAEKWFSIWRLSAILNLKNFDFCQIAMHPRNGNLHLRTKFDRNWIIHDWDMEIKLFSKWRPSAVLNLRKLPFWSRDWNLLANLTSTFRNSH